MRKQRFLVTFATDMRSGDAQRLVEGRIQCVLGGSTQVRADDQTHNGWANYETWLVHLHLTNEQSTDAVARAIAKTGEEHDGAAALKNWVECMMPDGTGMHVDLIRAALGSVLWIELARSLREE